LTWPQDNTDWVMLRSSFLVGTLIVTADRRNTIVGDISSM
jgi:hypothetical protein